MADPEHRSVDALVDAVHTTEGEGLPIRRAFPQGGLRAVDPFLLLDHFGPIERAPGAAGGVPDHPHRGFETVTYMLAGEIEHKDSNGSADIIGPGDVQWMTAGAGIVHSEMPSDAFRDRGGELQGFQLWVNLPRRHKMLPSGYQMVTAAKMPTVQLPGDAGTVKVIAGQAMGTGASVHTNTPILYLHIALRPGGEVALPVARSHNVVAYALAGRGLCGPDRRALAAGQVAILADDGDAVGLAAAGEPLDVLVLAGEPLGEPVVSYGPFVMSTPEEIQQAISDYQRGAMGRITI